MKAKKRSCARGLSLGGATPDRFEHAARNFAQTPFQSELTQKFSIIINAKAASGRVIYHMMLSEKRHSTAIRPKWSQGRVCWANFKQRATMQQQKRPPDD